MKISIILLGLVLCLPSVAAEKKPLTKEESAKVIEAAIRKELKKPTGELTKADLEKVTKLYLRSNKLTEVPKGLEKLTQLRELNLWDNKLTDVKDLEKLTHLTSLSLSNNRLTNVTGLEKLTQLRTLHLGGNPLTNVKGLENLTQLTYLSISNNQLTKLTDGLEKLTQLKRLDLMYNKLTDVKGLEKLTQLKTLWLRYNKLTDLKGLEKLTQLTSLNLFDNPDITKDQIDELKKALPKCRIISDPTK